MQSKLSDFQMIRKLGEGAYSVVQKVKRISDGEDYAMKSIKMQQLSQKERENAINEIRFLASIKCDQIISYKESFFDEQSNTLHIIMEYCAGGDLLHKINTLKKKNQYLDEQVIWSYIIQLTKGIKKLHDMNIFHRDIKSANAFLSRDHKKIKLGDLNVSKVAKQGLLYTQTGTPYYASPEVWRDKPYNSKSDIWSLGCVFYELITLNPPFRASSMEGLFKVVQKGQYQPIPQFYSQELSDFLEYCLQVNSRKRMSAKELLECSQIQKRLHLAINEPSFIDNNEVLLKTIRIGRNLKSLNAILPQSQYELQEQSAPELMDHTFKKLKDLQINRSCSIEQQVKEKRNYYQDLILPPIISSSKNKENIQMVDQVSGKYHVKKNISSISNISNNSQIVKKVSNMGIQLVPLKKIY